VKFWLIVFFLTPEGEYLSKQEMQLSNKTMCELVAEQYPAQVREGPVKTICVSDDHYTGKKQDKNVPFD
jgi:hypothetical protein